MTALLHGHDADGAPAGQRHRGSVHIRGGVSSTRVDVAELRSIESRLDVVVDVAARLGHMLLGARQRLERDAHVEPVPAAAATEALDAAVHGSWGARRLEEEAFELLMALRYARFLYEEAELAVHARTPAPSWVGYLSFVIAPGAFVQQAVFSVGGRLALVGRLPGYEPRSGLGHLVDGLGEAVNVLMGGDDDLPPDGIALDMAARQLGEYGQHVFPWFALPGPITHDGRTFDPNQLTATQRLLIPIVARFHRWTGRRPGSATDLTLAVSRSRQVDPPADLPAVVDSLRAIHQDNGATPGTVEVRRTDHPDGTRSWTVLLPSTQAMVPGGRNPVDNLTNAETYSGMVSDVEIGAAEAMRLAGIQPGEAVALLGFSQGGLVGMRLAADPLVRRRYNITTVVTAGSPVGHLPTPAGTEVLHLEHLEDPIIGLDATSNPAETTRTTVSRSLAIGTTGQLWFDIAPTESHSITEYARTAELALEAGEASVAHVSERLAAISGGAGARVTATAFRLERGG